MLYFFFFFVLKLLELPVLQREHQKTVCACAFLPLSAFVISSPHPVLELLDQNYGKESGEDGHWLKDILINFYSMVMLP